ncbi:MAG: aminotransferase class I/II-fold pyridoxal phosphate-dependent enzyme [Gemmatimonadetes bacterium]|nr:aminotransferase class I/II-fold pyridoxal phosphate-dependent enzyme [Gemmatimonadota bacterium]
MRFSDLTARIAGEGTDAWIVHDLAVARQLRGDDVILLSIGDPDFDTPRPIRDAAIAALDAGRTHYAPIGGEPRLRDAIAAHEARTLGIPVDPACVTIFPGAQAALYAVAQCLVNPGDEVIALDPAYVTYEPVFQAPGATLVTVPLRPEHRFHVEPDVVARAITPRTRGIILNFPHNPTGAGLTGAEAAGIAALCRAHDLWCISDEVYASLTFDEPHVSVLVQPGMRERGILVSSLSKSHAMTGWRCGWAVTPPALARHLDHLARAMFFGVAQFVQDAAAVALAAHSPDLEHIRASYVQRARTMVAGLAHAPGRPGSRAARAHRCTLLQTASRPAWRDAWCAPDDAMRPPAQRPGASVRFPPSTIRPPFP